MKFDTKSKDLVLFHIQGLFRKGEVIKEKRSMGVTEVTHNVIYSGPSSLRTG